MDLFNLGRVPGSVHNTNLCDSDLEKIAFSHSVLGLIAGIVYGIMSSGLVDVKAKSTGNIYRITKADYEKLLKQQVYQERPNLSPQEVKKLTRVIFTTQNLFSLAIKAEEDSTAKTFFGVIQGHVLKELGDSSKPFDLKNVLVNYALSDEEGAKYVTRLLSRLHEVSNEMPLKAQLLINETAKALSNIAYQDLSMLQPSLQSRETKRPPTDIIFDLLSFLKDKSDPNLKQLEEQAKYLFMSHNLTIDMVKTFLDWAQVGYANTEVAKKCQVLSSQLMDEIIYTQLNDNIYGRAFDSSFVVELVRSPPPEVGKAMTEMSLGLAKHLKKLKLSGGKHARISQGIQKLLTQKDPRFWFPAVPELANLATTKGDVVQGLIDYLKKEKISGNECISIPYLMVKISLILKDEWISPPWLKYADEIYSGTMHPTIHWVRINRLGDKMNTPGAGITLHYQPSFAAEDWMTPSERPTTVRKPSFAYLDSQDIGKKALVNAMQRSVPWASGMSGSTNISLHAWEHFNKTTAIDPKAAFLGIMMFLVYDGGHSMNEPLWAASTIDERLKLGFDLGPKTSIENFVPDYEKFKNIFDGDLHKSVSNAFEKSFENTIEYYKKNSFYAQSSN